MSLEHYRGTMSAQGVAVGQIRSDGTGNVYRIIRVTEYSAGMIRQAIKDDAELIDASPKKYRWTDTGTIVGEGFYMSIHNSLVSVEEAITSLRVAAELRAKRDAEKAAERLIRDQAKAERMKTEYEAAEIIMASATFKATVTTGPIVSTDGVESLAWWMYQVEWDGIAYGTPGRFFVVALAKEEWSWRSVLSTDINVSFQHTSGKRGGSGGTQYEGAASNQTAVLREIVRWTM